MGFRSPVQLVEQLRYCHDWGSATSQYIKPGGGLGTSPPNSLILLHQLQDSFSQAVSFLLILHI